MTEKSILVVAAHPDDEILGCAGRIAKHVDDGDVVHVLILAEGATARSSGRNTESLSSLLEDLRQAARNAADCLGVKSLSFAGYADNRMDGLDLLDVVKVVEARIEEVDPEIIYTHHGGDLNVDHQITHQAVLTASRPLPGARVRTVMVFETLSSTEWASPTSESFQPNIFVNISKQWVRKRQAIEAYDTEMRAFPHPRSEQALESLAKLRGSTCGCEMAEAFMLIRQVID